MISIRKLVAIDMSLHGSQWVIAEFALGALLPALLAVLPILRGATHLSYLGWYLLSIAANYLPLLYFAICLARAGEARRYAGPEIEDRRQVIRFTKQQLFLLVPCFMLVAAAWQLFRGRIHAESQTRS